MKFKREIFVETRGEGFMAFIMTLLFGWVPADAFLMALIPIPKVALILSFVLTFIFLFFLVTLPYRFESEG